MSSSVQISVICMVYNHEKYLRKCLDGIMMQQGVKFEVIIHDDASSDSSRAIIEKYKEKYPDVVRTILQTDNQYSKGVWPEQFPFTMATGKYLAICEGDDYWTDPMKLKKQFEAMELNQSCVMCLHCVQLVTESDEPMTCYYPKIEIATGRITPDQYFDLRNAAGYFHTTSYFFITKELQKYCSNPPLFARRNPALDENLLLYFASLGDIFYINEVMSRYRVQSRGSWSEQFNSKMGLERTLNQIRHNEECIQMYAEFDHYTKGRWNSYFSKVISEYSAWQKQLILNSDSRLFELFRYPYCRKYIPQILRPYISKRIFQH